MKELSNMKKKNKTTLAKASIKAEVNHQAATTALTVRLGEITFPEGVETLGEKANFLHAYSVEASKRATGAAILAGWVLSVARSNCAYGLAGSSAILADIKTGKLAANIVNGRYLIARAEAERYIEANEFIPDEGTL